jgi:hypothetical protein
MKKMILVLLILIMVLPFNFASVNANQKKSIVKRILNDNELRNLVGGKKKNNNASTPEVVKYKLSGIVYKQLVKGSSRYETAWYKWTIAVCTDKENGEAITASTTGRYSLNVSPNAIYVYAVGTPTASITGKKTEQYSKYQSGTYNLPATKYDGMEQDIYCDAY